MAVISEYEEEEEPVPKSKPPASITAQQEVRSEPVMTTSSQTRISSQSQSDNELHQHDHVLRTLLEEHKRQPLELLTTVIDFLFRETDLSREGGVECRVTEIVTAAKRRRSAYEGEDVAPEKVAKVEDNKITMNKELPNKDPKGSKIKELSETKNQASSTTEKSLTKTNNLDVNKTSINEGIGAANVSHLTLAPTNVKDSPDYKTEGTDDEIDEGTGLILHKPWAHNRCSVAMCPVYNAEPNSGNGFDHEKYSWTQTLSEISLHIHMPEGTKARAVECDIKKKIFRAGLKGQQSFLEGNFTIQ